MCAQSLKLTECRQVRQRTEPVASTVKLKPLPLVYLSTKMVLLHHHFTDCSSTRDFLPIDSQGLQFSSSALCPKPAALLYSIARNVNCSKCSCTDPLFIFQPFSYIMFYFCTEVLQKQCYLYCLHVYVHCILHASQQWQPQCMLRH